MRIRALLILAALAAVLTPVAGPASPAGAQPSNGALEQYALAGSGPLDDHGAQIHTVAEDGSGQRSLTQGAPWAVEDPAWSPDGTRIAWSAHDGATAQIYVSNTDGSNRRVISNVGAGSDPTSNSEPVWSPDGTRIAWHGSDPTGFQIWVADPDGTDRVAISPVSAGADPTLNTAAAWSPDGTRIAWSGDDGATRQIYVANANGTGRAAISPVSGGIDPTFNAAPEFSPDGTRIAWHGTDALAVRQVYVANANGTGRVAISPVSAGVDPTGNSDPVWSPDGTRIAWSGYDGATSQIYVANANGTSRTPISFVAPLPFPVDNNSPRWSSANRIAWYGETASGYHILGANPDGSDRTVISTVAADPDPVENYAPAWSADGTRIAWIGATSTAKGAPFDLYVADADGTARTQISDEGVDPRLNDAPAWSPDGTRIAWDGHHDELQGIWVAAADGRGRVRISGPAEGTDPVWSPDGTRIVWDGRDGELYVADADGANRFALTLVGGPAADESRDPAWSPDGTRIAWSGTTGGDTQLYVANADGTGRTAISGVAPDPDPTGNGTPAWSPDSSRIAWAGTIGGTPEILVANADGTGRTAISPVSGGTDPDLNSNPAWSPDGTRIAWNGQLNGTQQIIVAATDGTGRVAISGSGAGSDPRDNRYPTWAPDGHAVAWRGQVDRMYQLLVAAPDGSGRRVVGDRLGYGAPAWSPVPVWRPDLDPAARYVPLPPTRVFDTRDAGPAGKLGPDATLSVQMTGIAGIPPDAVAVALNVTATEASGAGFVTVSPTGKPRPLASSLNLTVVDQTRPNSVIVPIGAGGKVDFYTQTGAHLLADVTGYWVDADTIVRAGRLVPLPPTRIFDTRNNGGAPVGAGASIDVQVTGVGGVPTSGVAAVVMNLTATEAVADGFVTGWPTGQPRPNASILNLTTGLTAPNLLIVPVGDGGRISLYTQSGAHLLGDVTGYLTDASASASLNGLYVPLTPARVFDTRTDGTGKLGAGATISTAFAGAGGIPTTGAGAAILTLTATDAETGFVTTWPHGQPQPLASTLNLTANPFIGPDTRPNTAIIPLGSGGQLDHYVQSPAHLLADTTGYLTG